MIFIWSNNSTPVTHGKLLTNNQEKREEMILMVTTMEIFLPVRLRGKIVNPSATEVASSSWSGSTWSWQSWLSFMMAVMIPNVNDYNKVIVDASATDITSRCIEIDDAKMMMPIMDYLTAGKMTRLVMILNDAGCGQNYFDGHAGL